MCSLLGENTKEGNSKRSQTNDWKRFFNYEKQGHKYIIREIYKEPKAKIDNTLYIRLIESLLAHELSTKPDYTNRYTRTNLFYILGMVNYYYIKKNRYLLQNETTDIPQWQINKFYQTCTDKLTDVFYSALKSMNKRCLLMYRDTYTIVENGFVDGMKTREKTFRIADKTEIENILRVERNVLNEMGLKKKPFFHMDIFYNKVNEKLNELYGWKSVYSEIELIYNQDQMQDALGEIKGDLEDELKKNRLTLNSNIIKAINEQAEKQLGRNRDEHKALFLKQIDESDEWVAGSLYDPNIRLDNFFQYPDDYVENQKELAELFLSIK